MFEQHKNIYQHAGKYDDQQNIKYIIDAAIDVFQPKTGCLLSFSGM